MPTALVTAAFSPLGKAIASTFRDAGWTVFGTSTKERDKGVLDRLYVADLAHDELVFDGISSLDALINNAGIFTLSSLEELSDEDYRSVFDLAVRGTLMTTRALLGPLKAADGAVVNISSMNAVHPGFGSTSHYDAAKAAVTGLTRSLAAETGLRINAVQPGLIFRDSLSGTELEAHYKAHSVRGRLMTCDEIARLVFFLATSTGIYGQAVTVDNGYTLC